MQAQNVERVTARYRRYIGSPRPCRFSLRATIAARPVRSAITQFRYFEELVYSADAAM